LPCTSNSPLDRRFLGAYRDEGRTYDARKGVVSLGAAIGIGVVVVLYVIGRVVGAASNPPTVTVGSNDSETTECRDLCNQWDARRQERCNAEKDEVTAKARADALRSQFLAYIAAGVALAGAAVAAASIPFFGTAIAAGLAAAAAVFFALATFTAGQLGAAEIDLAQKAKAAQDARAAEAAARALLVQKCTNSQEVTTCLARPSPC
jgi:hypothetical protein